MSEQNFVNCASKAETKLIVTLFPTMCTFKQKVLRKGFPFKVEPRWQQWLQKEAKF